MSLLKRTPLLLGLLGFLPTAASAGQYQNFNAAVYVRAYEVQLMKDPAWLRDNWAIVERQVKVDKVYLETHRDLIIVDDATLQQAKAFFQAKGIVVAGGIATVRNESNLFEVFCYTQAGQRAKMREIVEATARNFDEFIIDDFFFTSCTCDECIAAKGDRSWTRFRLDLMKEVSRDLILKTAHTVNPKVKVTLKYPNWYEHYQGTGYNLEDEPPLYDKIYTGTETRDPVHTGQHLQPYHSYEAFRYLENIKPGGNGGGWVDSGARGNADRYAEQFWLTMFAKAPEITLFAMNELLMPFGERDRASWQGQGTSFDYAKAQARCAGSPAMKPTLAAVAGQALELADSVVGKLGKPIGLVAYKPFHSTGEDFIHNFLGMVGLPIEMVPQFPVDAPHGAVDREREARPCHCRQDQGAVARRQERGDHHGPATGAARPRHRGYRRDRSLRAARAGAAVRAARTDRNGGGAHRAARGALPDQRVVGDHLHTRQRRRPPGAAHARLQQGQALRTHRSG
ncbi:MAG: hypothetical protein IPL39_18425 [Opitutaceae bacterium]|nr:hypothetical protein [Opitutaceae bacterium]